MDLHTHTNMVAFPGGSGVNNPTTMLEILVWSVGREDLLGGHGNPLQYSGLENSMDRGAG